LRGYQESIKRWSAMGGVGLGLATERGAPEKEEREKEKETRNGASPKEKGGVLQGPNIISLNDRKNRSERGWRGGTWQFERKIAKKKSSENRCRGVS